MRQLLSLSYKLWRWKLFLSKKSLLLLYSTYGGNSQVRTRTPPSPLTYLTKDEKDKRGITISFPCNHLVYIATQTTTTFTHLSCITCIVSRYNKMFQMLPHINKKEKLNKQTLTSTPDYRTQWRTRYYVTTRAQTRKKQLVYIRGWSCRHFR